MPPAAFTRPAYLAAALALAACGAPDSEERAPNAPDGESETLGAPGADTPGDTGGETGGEAASGPDVSTLTGAVEAAWRGPAARERDSARNPVDTLAFFGIEPSGTVIEIWPGAGWYADILAPWVSANGGRYVAAWPPAPAASGQAAELRARFAARYDGGARGEAELVTFGPGAESLADAGPADAIVTFRNVHNFMAAGFGEIAFQAFHDALKPGGVLGVVEHRLPADRVQDPRAASGYVQQDYVIALAREAGLELVEAAEINANPADDADHPFGVWTLPPVARTSPLGEPPDPDFDRSAYDAIGESDRMTLVFRRPMASEGEGATEGAGAAPGGADAEPDAETEAGTDAEPGGRE